MSTTEDDEFVADAKIDFRITGYRKKQVKRRARELRKTLTGYMKWLISEDMKEGKGD